MNYFSGLRQMCMLIRNLCNVRFMHPNFGGFVVNYQEVRWYFLVRDGAGLKWPPVHKVQEQPSEKRSRGVKKAYRLHHFAFLLLNLP